MIEYEKDFSQITKEHNDTMLLTKMTLKSIKVIQKQIKVSNEEIQEMINYFSKMEYYHICSRLKNESK
jgi:hypothetical protein